MKNEKLTSKIVVTLVALLMIIYVGVAWYLQEQFLYGTRIGIVNTSWMTVEEAEEILQESLASYSVTVQAKDGTEAVITSADVDMKYDLGTAVHAIKDSQEPLEWLPALLSDPVRYELDCPVIYDKEKMEACLAKIPFLDTETMIAPVNAELNYSEDTGFSYTRSVEGTTIDKDKFMTELEQTLAEGSDMLDLAEAGCYILPSVTEDNAKIRDMIERLETVTDFEISYAFGDETVEIGKEDMWTWFGLDENNEIVLVESRVKAFVADFADKYDTLGGKREFTTHKGSVIEVSDGPYGWKINQNKEYEELLSLIREQKSDKGREPVYSRTGHGERPGINDIGDTYVEICIEDQKMYYYEEGKLYLETDVVTGNGGRHTKRGVCFIHNKARNATLVGDDYVSFVKYWMKIWNGIGIHDASWRWKFGGEIYLTNGSHGCINTPLENVIKLYERVEIGTPVIVY